MEASRPRRKQVSSCCQNSGCQRPPDPNHNACILYHLLCNLFVDWRRDFLLISTTFLSWSFVIVFIMCLLRFLAVTRPLYYRNQVTYVRVRKTLIVGPLWPCAHLILPAAGLRKFRLYSKGLYCAPDLTTEEPNNKILRLWKEA